MATGVHADLDAARALAANAGRTDLVERLDRATERLHQRDTAVAVVGEFKQGKSTLVNALLRTDVCPADADLVTALPTILRYGLAPAAFLQVPSSSGEVESVALEMGQVRGQIVAPEGDPMPRAVEVRLDRRLLGTGLSLIDTPGVGGLDSAQGNLTLATLPLASAALFVTDAAQELTAPEVDFLRRVVERCRRVALVLTKTDLYPEWRRIVDLDQAHLRDAGLDVPVVAVSSFLRMRAHARNSSELNAESGFPRLVSLLQKDVVAAVTADREAAARAELALVVADLREQLGAQRAVAAAPARADDVAARYTEIGRRGAALSAGSWQTVLGDGIQDLAADVDHDLRERLRLLLRHGEDLLEESDPRETWSDFQAWAAREAAAAAADNMMLLVSRSSQLAEEVAERFELEYARLDVDLPASELALRKVGELDVSFQKSGVRQFLGAFMAARVAYGSFVMLGAVGALFNVALVAPIAVVAGLTLGRRMIKSERERQVQQRRAQARAELRRYVDDVGFHLGRDCREAVRRTQRHLRDEFAARAREIERSAAATAASVREIAALPPEQRQARADSLTAQQRALDRLAS